MAMRRSGVRCGVRGGMATALVGLMAGALAGAAAAQAPGAGMGATRSVDQAEADRYLDALDELMALARSSGKTDPDEGDPPSVQQLLGGLAMGEQWQAILARHGFDPQSFGVVHGSIWQAFGALQMKQHAPQLEAMAQQNAAMLEQMKEQMSPEDYEKAVASMARASRHMQSLTADVPAGNLELVEKLAPRLRKLDGGS